MEVIRAFRLNDRVRELLLPILPKDILGNSSSAVSGVDVQAQVEAFEITFQRMDVDGSNAVTLDEFEDFFVSCAEGKPPPRRKAMSLNPKKASKREKREAQLRESRNENMAKAHGVHGSSSTTNLPAIKGGKGGGGPACGAEAFRRGQPAPGLQRLMQTSFTDTWKKPVAMPHGSARGKGGDASSPRCSRRARAGSRALAPPK